MPEQPTTTMKRHPDVLIVSFPKSGRTWIRVFLSRYRQGLLSAPEFDIALHRRPGPGATYDFSHAGADPKFGFLRLRKPLLRNASTGFLGSLPHWFYGIRTILIPPGSARYVFLVRDPRDVLVSFYHQGRSRNRFWKLGIDAFARSPFVGIARIVALMNHLAEQSERLNALFVCYEDLVRAPERQFSILLEHGSGAVDHELLREAVRFASFENMRRMEETGRYGKRLKQRRKGDDNAMKTRRGRVGGYGQELPEDTIAFVEEYLEDHLDPYFRRYVYRTPPFGAEAPRR